MTDESALTRAELDDIFASRITLRLSAAGAGPTSRPEAVMFAAQPGAGKSVALGLHAPETDYVYVIGDDLRRFHPDYRRLMRTDPAAMPAATSQASGQWVQRGLAWAREQSRSVAWETTLRAPEVLDDLRRFAERGWKVRVVALAVPREVSLAGTVRRYLDELREHGAGRASPLDIHDQAYVKGPHALTLIRQQLPDVQLTAVDRAGEVLVEGDAVPDVIAEAHSRPLTDQERAYVASELAAADAQVAALRGRGVELDPVMLANLAEARRGLEGGPDARQYAAEEGWWRPTPAASPSFPSHPVAATQPRSQQPSRRGPVGLPPTPGRGLDR